MKPNTSRCRLVSSRMVCLLIREYYSTPVDQSTKSECVRPNESNEGSGATTQAGSQGSQTGQVRYPCSRASATCLKYARSGSGIRLTQVQSLLWTRRDVRCAQNGSP